MEMEKTLIKANGADEQQHKKVIVDTLVSLLEGLIQSIQSDTFKGYVLIAHNDQLPQDFLILPKLSTMRNAKDFCDSALWETEKVGNTRPVGYV